MRPFVLCLFLAAQLSAQPKTGPAIGAVIPAFSAPDQDGRTQSLSTIAGPKGAMLVFFRSADWWPFCKGQLVELQGNLDKIRAKGLGVAAISYDSPAVLKSFAERRHITFPLLSDPDSKIIRAFGILNETVQEGTSQYGIPYPGTYFVDPKGRVTARYFEDDYTQRYTSAEILVRQFGENIGATHASFEAKHLQVTASASNARVRAGQRISLVLEVDLAPRLHVYAPGVSADYIPIDWTMKESPAILIKEAAYPASKKLRLEAIKETVPVYQGAFRLVRDVTIARDAAVRPLLDPEGRLTIEAALKYQACDDKVCYPPETVPVRWTLQVEALDRERAPADLQRKPK